MTMTLMMKVDLTDQNKQNNDDRHLVERIAKALLNFLLLLGIEFCIGERF